MTLQGQNEKTDVKNLYNFLIRSKKINENEKNPCSP